MLTPAEIEAEPAWRGAFADEAKDRRYYELLHRTMGDQFSFRYVVIEEAETGRAAVQPVFFVDQNLLATAPGQRALGWVRSLFPRFGRSRMLMIGCAAGPGQLVIGERALPVMMEMIEKFSENASLVVWKDFKKEHRAELAPLGQGGYTRVPSMPMTRLPLDFSSFEEFMQTRLSKVMRKNLRRKFRGADGLRMEVLSDATAVLDEIHPLYLQVHERSALKFERLTREFMSELGRTMADRARFFIWRLDGRAVAFSLCLVHDGTIHDEYLGLDYTVALDRSLYFITFRDLIEWALAHGVRNYVSSPLNYDPKLHLGCELVPLDLYAAHTSRWLNPFFKMALRLVQPTRSQPILRKFRNANEL